MWWRRSVAVLLGAGLVLGVGVVALVIGVNLRHPRDEAGYLTYLRLYGDPSSDAPLTDLPARPGLISAGNDACAWLSGQEFALWRTSPAHRYPATITAYLESTRTDPIGWSGPPDRSTIAVAAWSHLCPATRELHKPHYVFSRPPSD